MALTDLAHERGLVVVVHVSSVAGVREVLDAGVDVLAHVPADALMDEGLVQRLLAQDNTRRLAQSGVPLLAGTDAPNPGLGFIVSWYFGTKVVSTRRRR